VAKIGKKQLETLCSQALKAREVSYAPYSGFRVGAALLAKDGQVFTGCNIENGAYSPSMCAERVAFAKAVSGSCREFAAIAVAGGAADTPDDYCPPCGVCRQVMAEFCGPDFLIILVKSPVEYKTYAFSEILPLAFKL
jgi:cytidine deaminase